MAAESGGKGIFGFLAFLVISALLGSLLGELLGVLVPDGTLHAIFVKGFPIGLTSPFILNLRVLTFTFAGTLNFNLCSFLGIVFGFMFFRK